MPEFEEWPERGKIDPSGSDIEKNHTAAPVRYSLKRGRLPQTKKFEEQENFVTTTAKVVDVEHDAIGSRSRDKEGVRSSPVKKTTEIVKNSNVARENKQGRDDMRHSHQKTPLNAKDHKFEDQKSRRKSWDKKFSDLEESGPIEPKHNKPLRKLGILDKILKFFGIGSKNHKKSDEGFSKKKKIKYFPGKKRNH
jgi:hypothetical protein